ncbi:MAG: hypothetical protein D6692_07475 [Planctomycetota bacterium]|nr:MAG: hypothetical protein D6692_07475 [Planctomycetota bacterium]
MPDAPTPEEGETIAEHFAYYERLLAEGTLILAGRTLEPPFIGLMLFRADSPQAAQAVVDADPAVARGVMRARVQPYRVALHGHFSP